MKIYPKPIKNYFCRFNQPLNSALKTNVLGSKRLMDFCGTFKDLQVNITFE